MSLLCIRLEVGVQEIEDKLEVEVPRKLVDLVQLVVHTQVAVHMGFGLEAFGKLLEEVVHLVEDIEVVDIVPEEEGIASLDLADNTKNL